MERLKPRRPKYLAPEFWVLLPTSWVTVDKSLPWGSVFSCKKKKKYGAGVLEIQAYKFY